MFLGNGVNAAVVNDRIYLFGGTDFTTTRGGIYEYNPSQDSWNLKKEMTVRNSTGITAINGKVYLLGGSDNVSVSALSTADIYDPTTNELSNITNLTSARSQAVAAAVDNQLFIIGGTTLTDSGAVKTVEVYTVRNEEPVEPEPSDRNNRAILTIYLTNGTEKEYDLSMTEVNAFIDWYDKKDAGVGPAKYAFIKNWNKGPFSKRTEYVIFDKILTFNVDEYFAEE